MMLYDDVEGQAGAFDKIPPERQQRWTLNARTLGPMFAGLQIAPYPLTCDRIGSISVPTLVVRGENTIPFQRASAEAFHSACLPAVAARSSPCRSHVGSEYGSRRGGDTGIPGRTVKIAIER